jgi:hypothetical protein
MFELEHTNVHNLQAGGYELAFKVTSDRTCDRQHIRNSYLAGSGP